MERCRAAGGLDKFENGAEDVWLRRRLRYLQMWKGENSLGKESSIHLIDTVGQTLEKISQKAFTVIMERMKNER